MYSAHRMQDKHVKAGFRCMNAPRPSDDGGLALRIPRDLTCDLYRENCWTQHALPIGNCRVILYLPALTPEFFVTYTHCFLALQLFPANKPVLILSKVLEALAPIPQPCQCQYARMGLGGHTANHTAPGSQTRRRNTNPSSPSTSPTANGPPKPSQSPRDGSRPTCETATNLSSTPWTATRNGDTSRCW